MSDRPDTEKKAEATGTGPTFFKASAVTQQWKYTSPLTVCRFDPTGKYVFTAAQDNRIQRWDFATGEHVVFEGHESWLRGLGFSLDGRRLFSAGYDGQLIFWNAVGEQPKPQRKIAAHDGWVRWLEVSPDGKLIATGGNDNLVKLWSADDGRLLQTFAGHESHVYSTLFHPHGEMLLSGDLSGKVHLWELSSAKQMRSFDATDLHTYNGGQRAHYGGVRSMSLSPDLKHLACSGLHKASNPFGAVQEPLVVVFDWESGKKVRSHVADGIPKGIVWRVVYHPSGYLVGSSGGGSGGFILFWKRDQDKEVFKLKLPNTVLDMDMHPDKNHLVTAHHDRHIRATVMKEG